MTRKSPWHKPSDGSPPPLPDHLSEMELRDLCEIAYKITKDLWNTPIPLEANVDPAVTRFSILTVAAHAVLDKKYEELLARDRAHVTEEWCHLNHSIDMMVETTNEFVKLMRMAQTKIRKSHMLAHALEEQARADKEKLDQGGSRPGRESVQEGADGHRHRQEARCDEERNRKPSSSSSRRVPS